MTPDEFAWHMAPWWMKLMFILWVITKFLLKVALVIAIIHFALKYWK